MNSDLDPRHDRPQPDEDLPSAFRRARSRIMYIESKADGPDGLAMIGGGPLSPTRRQVHPSRIAPLFAAHGTR